MQKITRRQWLIRVGGAALAPAVFSSCRPDISRDVESVGSRLASAYVPVKPNGCVACDNCMPCPYGLDIPAILLHYNKCINEGNVPASTQSKDYREARRAFLIGYDRSVPKLRQANHCIGCNQCAPHCPQSIDIPSELHRIDSFVENLKQNV